jgi:hypothetical protein
VARLSRILGALAEHDALSPDRREKLDRHLKSAITEPWADTSLDRFIIGLRDHYREARIWLLIQAEETRELWRIGGGKIDAFDPEDAAYATVVGALLAKAPTYPELAVVHEHPE